MTKGIQTMGNGKAVIVAEENGGRTLYSYDTPIINFDPFGVPVRLWDGWSATTGRHIKEFCGMSKAEFMKVQYIKK